MMKAAIFEYIPKRYLRRATFEQKDTNRMILGFKDGRNVYSRWAARLFAQSLALTDLHDVTVVCIPASTRCAHVRRWKRFLRNCASVLVPSTALTTLMSVVAVSGHISLVTMNSLRISSITYISILITFVERRFL